MQIVIYSSNSNYFDGNIVHYYNYPSNRKFWETYQQHHFVFITQLPGMFLLDLDKNEICEKASNVEYVIAEPTVDLISSYNPDIVIAGTFWVTPFDWLPIKDALIGEELRNRGIKTYCHSLETTQICFDKRMTHDFLSAKGFNVAKAVYIHHEMFWAERNHNDVRENYYKESVLHQISKLNYPVVIKDTTGLSSYGMEVCTTFKQAAAFLKSKKNNGDKLVEEFLQGIQFGTEIHGDKEKGYKFYEPFMFSVNQYGITSPKQSIKLGPINNPKYKIDVLKKELIRLTEEMDFSGVAQVDLVYSESEQKWYIIEINPRLSGMTQTLLYQKDLTFSLKIPVLTDNQLEYLNKYEFIHHISQVLNDAAKQRRECGYCEIIFSGKDKSQLSENLNILRNENQNIPDLIDDGFYSQALKMLELM